MFFDHLFYQTIKPETIDEHWMWFALKEATRGYGFTKPNPLVGAVITAANGELVSTGYHALYGHDHAEINAIKNAPADFDFSTATLYTTLEPCCHTAKKTPPCLTAILNKKFKRVVIGMTDPNPLVNGKSIEAMKKNGIAVTQNVLEKAVRYLNRDFIHFQTTGKPYLHLKMALSLDGSMGPDSSHTQKWMTNDKAKKYVHFLRAGAKAILIGGNTYRSDLPKLNCRMENFLDQENFIQPEKIILSKNKECNPTGFLKIDSLESINNLKFPNVLVEAGPKIQSQLLEHNFYQEISIILAPLILGNKQKIEFENNYALKDALNLSHGKWITFDDNLLFHWVR